MTSLRAIKPIDAPLYVVTCVSNSQRFLSRYRLYREFEKRVIDAGAKLITVELTYGERAPEILDNENVNYIPLQSTTELWQKEAMLNIGISQLPPNWRYVAWVDADVEFVRPDWVQETLHQLQHYQVVQLFSHARDLGPNYEPLAAHTGFMYCYKNNMNPGKSYQHWHPGFAWAARREAINYLGGLIDWAILGAADRHMACSLVGRLEDSFPPELKEACPRYYKKLLLWQARAEKFIQRNVGYVHGLLLHYWHGSKADRRYMDRWKILFETNYNPDIDLRRDWQGLWQLTDRSMELRDRIRQYFNARNEDSIDVD